MYVNLPFCWSVRFGDNKWGQIVDRGMNFEPLRGDVYYLLLPRNSRLLHSDFTIDRTRGALRYIRCKRAQLAQKLRNNPD